MLYSESTVEIPFASCDYLLPFLTSYFSAHILEYVPYSICISAAKFESGLIILLWIYGVGLVKNSHLVVSFSNLFLFQGFDFHFDLYIYHILLLLARYPVEVLIIHVNRIKCLLISCYALNASWGLVSVK